MAKFGSSASLRLHRTGTPADICLMVGSAFEEPLIVVDDSTDAAIPLTGWTAVAKGELHKGHWSNDDLLLGAILVSNPSIAPFPVAIADQALNAGMITIEVAENVLPADDRNIAIGEDTLPTFYVWVRLSAPLPSKRIVQTRLAIGYRRGYGSLA